MKVIPKFVYIEIPGNVYILHTQPPLIIGRVWMYKSMQELVMQMEKIKADCIYFDQHCISISWWYVLGDRMIMHEGTKEEIKQALAGMMDFFIETRVKKSPKYYDKFRI